MLEGPARRRPNGFFQRMDDGKLRAYAEEQIRQEKYARRTEMKSADPNLYRTLCSRGVLGRLKFRKDEHRWKGKGDEEVLAMALKKMRQRCIESSTALSEADSGLYHELWQRKLLSRLPFQPKKRADRDWASMEDGAVVSDNQRFIDENKIRNKRALQDADIGRYNILYSRGLLPEVKFPKARRCWAAKSDAQLLEDADRLISEKMLGSKTALMGADLGLYLALQKRGLLEKVALDARRRGGICAKATAGAPDQAELARRFVEWPEAQLKPERERREKAFVAKWKAEAEAIAYETKAPARAEDRCRFALEGLYAAAGKSRSEKELKAILRQEVARVIMERASGEKITWKPGPEALERPAHPADAETASALRLALGELGAGQRKIVELAFVKQKGDEEASRTLGMSVAAFREAKKALVERMRQRLEGYL